MKNRSILLVEDNADDVALMLHALKSNRITNQISVAEDGEQALNMLFSDKGEAANQPALILLDLNLPKVEGLEVLRQLRANADTRLIPVVVLTSSLEQSDLQNAYGYGANSYLRKPVDFEEFVQVTRDLGHYWLQLNNPAVEA
ncbi:MAG: response regulator [Halopseudomonas sp.]|uniref:response regulator n=1 Tax=Halopseudomonas sp. TaxID=2901191 RepID=UPI0030010D53